MSAEYQQGATIQSLAIQYGVAASVVRRSLDELGIPIRTRTAHLKTDRNPTRGKGHTPEAIAKIREANARQFSTAAARERHAHLTAQQIADGRTGKAYNRLETLVASLLATNEIPYVQQYRLGRYVFDFYLPERHAFIEVHGTFWHADPRFYASALSPIQVHNRANDERKKKYAAELGFGYCCLWEHDIHAFPSITLARLQSH